MPIVRIFQNDKVWFIPEIDTNFVILNGILYFYIQLSLISVYRFSIESFMYFRKI